MYFIRFCKQFFHITINAEPILEVYNYFFMDSGSVPILIDNGASVCKAGLITNNRPTVKVDNVVLRD